MARNAQALLLGGDCSILIGAALALKRRGRYGLVFLDAHSDFRHLGNSPSIGAAAGEDLAIVTGRGDAGLINIEALGPYFRHDDIHVVGIRANDLEIAEFAALGLRVTASDAMVGTSIAHLADEIIATTTQGTEGLWIHFDPDVIDASKMPAVDCPEPGGPGFAEVAALLRHLLQSPLCVGLELTIFDPDLDPDGKLAERLVECLVQAFRRDNAGQCVMRADRLTRSLNSDFGTLKA